MLYSDTGTALPDETSVGYNDYASWTSWTDFGKTNSPARIQHTKEHFFFDDQLRAYPSDIRIVSKRTMIRFSVTELTSATLALLFDGTASTTAAGAGQKGYFDVDYGSDLTTTVKQIALEGFRVDSANTQQPVRWFIYKAVINLEGDFAHNKRDSMSALVTIYPMSDTGKTIGQDVGKIQVVTAPATS